MLLFPLWGFSQPKSGSIKGIITDKSGAPLIGATLELTDKNNPKNHFYEVSKEGGEYMFLQAPEGAYTLSIHLAGYAPFLVDVRVEADKTNAIPAAALDKAADKELAGVEVVAVKKPAIEVQADKTVFNVENSPTSSGLSGLDLLRKSPGVTIDNNNNIQLGGVGGVRVFLNGKPTYISGDQLTQFLNSIRSENIQKIELINNPSSKYEAEGSGGIINIVLKQGAQGRGISGSVTADLGLLTYTGKYKGSYGFSLNYMNKKGTTFRGSYGLSHGMPYMRFGSNREQEEMLYKEWTANDGDEINHNINVGVDHEFNKHHSLSLNLRLNFANDDPLNQAYSEIYGKRASGQLDSFLRTLYNPSPQSQRNYQIVPSVSYTYTNEKAGTFSVSSDYFWYRNKDDNRLDDIYYANRERTAELSSNPYRQIADAAFNIFAIKGDWVKQFKKIKIEAGVKYSNSFTDNNFKQNKFSAAGASVLDTNASSLFEYSENVFAAYAQIQIPVKKFVFNVGLRDEYTRTNGVSKDIISTAVTKENKRSYNDLFPSFSVLYNINKSHSISLQGSRRILRPSYQDLNPFEVKESALRYRAGNPNLTPQYVYKISLAYSFFHKTNLSLSYTRTEDVIYPFLDKRDSSSFFTSRNIGTSDVWGISLSSPFTLMKIKETPFWTGFASLTFNYTTNKGIYNDANFSISFPRIQGYAEMAFRINEKMSAQLSGWFVGASVWGATVEHKSFGTLDIAVQHKFLKNKLTLKVYWRDVFQTAYISFYNNVAGAVLSEGRVRFPYPSVGFNAAYTFGSEGKQKAKSSAAKVFEEERRLKESGGLGGDAK